MWSGTFAAGAAVALTAWLASAPARAAVIVGADFGTPTSPVESGFVGQSAATQTFSGLSGVGSGSITMTFAGAPGNRDRAAPTSGASPDLYRDLFTALNETATGTTLSVSGLDPNTAYQVEVWSLDRGFNNGALYSWYDTTPATPVLLGTITNSTSATPASQSEFRVVGTVTADATGAIRLGHTDPVGTGTINGLRLSTVPEPGTAAAAGLVAAAGLLARRRHRRA